MLLSYEMKRTWCRMKYDRILLSYEMKRRWCRMRYDRILLSYETGRTWSRMRLNRMLVSCDGSRKMWKGTVFSSILWRKIRKKLPSTYSVSSYRVQFRRSALFLGTLNPTNCIDTVYCILARCKTALTVYNITVREARNIEMITRPQKRFVLFSRRHLIHR